MPFKMLRFISDRILRKRVYGFLSVLALLGTTLGTTAFHSLPSQAAATPINPYCQVADSNAAQKDRLRQLALSGDANAQRQYRDRLKQDADQLQRCRNLTWPQEQAIWIRLYPCDVQPGVLDKLFDQVVNRGYNQVYIETFYNGQVLLPAAKNPTVWPSVIRTRGQEDRDLLSEAIAKGRDRGLEVYSWLFTMNFGYSYAQRADRQDVLARNGRGQNSLAVSASEETFIDPYNLRAQQDYYRLVQEVAKRKPDGILFDYIRYPRGTGSASVASKVEDLWVYGDAARTALYRRGLNNKGRELIQRYVSRGYLTNQDLESLDKRYPNEGEPMWQGRIVPPTPTKTLDVSVRRQRLQSELWKLSVAHAMQGVVDFLNIADKPARQQGIPTGAVFFPGGNTAVGQGYDSRLQPWDRFSGSMTWHPMAYGVCGHTGCIATQVQQVLSRAHTGVQVRPVLAGVWGQSISGRPALEQQMQVIQRLAPQLQSVSHFAYSWQDPEFDRQRKFCRL